MKSINNIVSEILSTAKTKIGESLIERAAVINSCFDDAYGSCLGGHYASGIECVSTGLKCLDELLQYADDIMSTATGSEWEFVRDALGGVNMEKAPLEESIRNAYKLQIKRYVSPTFGDHNKHYVVKEKKITVESANHFEFDRAVESGSLVEATLDTLGASYYWDKEHGRWVLDCLINLAVRPWLSAYMK